MTLNAVEMRELIRRNFMLKLTPGNTVSSNYRNKDDVFNAFIAVVVVVVVVTVAGAVVGFVVDDF